MIKEGMFDGSWREISTYAIIVDGDPKYAIQGHFTKEPYTVSRETRLLIRVNSKEELFNLAKDLVRIVTGRVEQELSDADKRMLEAFADKCEEMESKKCDISDGKDAKHEPPNKHSSYQR